MALHECRVHINRGINLGKQSRLVKERESTGDNAGVCNLFDFRWIIASARCIAQVLHGFSLEAHSSVITLTVLTV